MRHKNCGLKWRDIPRRLIISAVAAVPASHLGVGACLARIDNSGSTAGWASWGNPAGGLRFSPLTQITPQNVGKLEVAWTYHMGPSVTSSAHPLFTFEATPIIGDGRMYVCSNVDKVVALDPETGKEIRVYDPKIDGTGVWLHNCRGVTFWHDDQAAAGGQCASRIFSGTLDGWLIALDAATGKPCDGFGENGQVNLKKDLGEVRPGEYSDPSPPVIAADKVILGAGVLDNVRIDIAAGVVRAFDARTGALSLAWNPLPPGVTDKDLAPAGERYAHGTTNAWTVFSVDAEHGLVYVPTGNTSPDHFGGLRHGPGLAFIAATSDDFIRAYDVTDGKEVWKERLPAGGRANPMTHRLKPDGKQYVVIAAGGHAMMGTKQGDSLIAYTFGE